jgi:class 3 adenylate cyclase
LAWERVKHLSQKVGPSPYSAKELSKHIDPILYRDLKNFQSGYVKKQLTVAFWDVSGFSQMCNDFSLQFDDIFIFLDKYFQKSIEIVKKNDGVLDKFIGDGVLAYFGYDSPTDNGDPYKAIAAALEFKNQFSILRKNFIEFCNEFNGKEPDISLKCGMDNGTALFHYFNTVTRNTITILGPTVNFASRLEGMAVKDEIIVSKTLMNMVKDSYNFEEIEAEVRNNSKFGKGIKAFEKEKYVYSLLENKQHSQFGVRL